MTETIDTCNTIIHYNTTDAVDVYAEKKLKSAYYEYKQAKKVPLASVRYIVNGKKQLSLLEAIVKFEELKKLEIHFLKPRINENWDFNTPTKIIKLFGHGLGRVEIFNYDSFSINKWDMSQPLIKERVMIRGFISRFYFPRSIKSRTADLTEGESRPFVPTLLTLEKMWQVIRTRGVVPFQIHVCAYTPNNRFTYDFDLMNNTLLKDFRGGTVPLRNRAERKSMEYFNFDKVLASTDMKDLVKRTFITLFEMDETTVFDIAHGFGITDTMAKNTLDAIVSRGLAEKEGRPPREKYFILPDNLEGEGTVPKYPF